MIHVHEETNGAHIFTRFAVVPISQKKTGKSRLFIFYRL